MYRLNAPIGDQQSHDETLIQTKKEISCYNKAPLAYHVVPGTTVIPNNANIVDILHDMPKK